MNIVTCPNCHIRVIPKANGSCPNCRSIVHKQKKPTSSNKAAKGRTSTKDVSLEQDDYDATFPKHKIIWKAINWTKVYADNRFRTRGNRPLIDHWLTIAIILMGFSVYSLITNLPVTVRLGGVPVVTTDRYLPSILLAIGVFMAVYRLRLLVGNRLVIYGRIVKKEIIKDARGGIKHRFLVNVNKEFTLNTKGELEPSNDLRHLSLGLMVDSSLYTLYNTVQHCTTEAI